MTEHEHDWRVDPTTTLTSIPLAWVLRLIEAIDELKLWEPGRKGYAAAHRRLMAERDWAWREITEGRDVTDAEPYVGFPLYGR